MTPKGARVAFIVFLLIIVAAFVYMASPLIKGVFLAAIIAALFYPVYLWMLRLVRGCRYLASMITTALCLLIVLIPAGLLIALGSTKIVAFIARIIGEFQAGAFLPMIDRTADFINAALMRLPGGEGVTFDLRSISMEMVRDAASFLYRYPPKMVASTFSVAINAVVMIIFVVVFFAEGAKIFAWVVRSLPISPSYQHEISRDIRVTISAHLLGMIAIAVVQGILLGAAFWVAGFSDPAMWGAIAMITAFIPIVGATVCYAISTLYLAVAGRPEAAAIFFLYGALIVSSVDNFIRPLLMGGRMRVHPVLLFVALVGGVRTFGPIGLIFGPVLLSVFLAALRIYQREFASDEQLSAQPS